MRSMVTMTEDEQPRTVLMLSAWAYRAYGSDSWFRETENPFHDIVTGADLRLHHFKVPAIRGHGKPNTPLNRIRELSRNSFLGCGGFESVDQPGFAPGSAFRRHAFQELFQAQ